MVENRHIWQNWAETLHRWGMHETAAILLEAMEPLRFIGAQVVYMSQPVLNIFLPEDHLNAFANLLDDPEEAKAFTHFLRQEPGGSI